MIVSSKLSLSIDFKKVFFRTPSSLRFSSLLDPCASKTLIFFSYLERGEWGDNNCLCSEFLKRSGSREKRILRNSRPPCTSLHQFTGKTKLYVPTRIVFKVLPSIRNLIYTTTIQVSFVRNYSCPRRIRLSVHFLSRLQRSFSKHEMLKSNLHELMVCDDIPTLLSDLCLKRKKD